MLKIRLFHHFVQELYIVNLKILQSDWLRAFWPKSQEPDFSQVWDLCKNTVNIIKFLYRPNSEKNNEKKFGPFSHFWGKKIFLKKSGPVMHNKTWAPKAQTLIHRTLLATAKGPSNKMKNFNFTLISKQNMAILPMKSSTWQLMLNQLSNMGGLIV